MVISLAKISIITGCIYCENCYHQKGFDTSDPYLSEIAKKKVFFFSHGSCSESTPKKNKIEQQRGQLSVMFSHYRGKAPVIIYFNRNLY